MCTTLLINTHTKKSFTILPDEDNPMSNSSDKKENLPVIGKPKSIYHQNCIIPNEDFSILYNSITSKVHPPLLSTGLLDKPFYSPSKEFFNKVSSKLRDLRPKMNEDNRDRKLDRPMFITTVKTGRFLEPPPEVAALLGLRKNSSSSTSSTGKPSDGTRNVIYSFASKPRILKSNLQSNTGGRFLWKNELRREKREILSDLPKIVNDNSDGTTQYGNTMYDRRVARGSNFASQRPNVISTEHILTRQAEARRRAAVRQRAQIRARKLRQGTPPPVDGRRHGQIQTDQYLEELSERQPDKSIACQADLPVDDSPVPFESPVNGVEAETQIYPGDLPDLDNEIPSVVTSIVKKILEEAILEINEEIEVIRLRNLDHEKKSNHALITRGELNALIQEVLAEIKESEDSNEQNLNNVDTSMLLENVFNEIKNTISDSTFLSRIIKTQITNWKPLESNNTSNETENVTEEMPDLRNETIGLSNVELQSNYDEDYEDDLEDMQPMNTDTDDYRAKTDPDNEESKDFDNSLEDGDVDAQIQSADDIRVESSPEPSGNADANNLENTDLSQTENNSICIRTARSIEETENSEPIEEGFPNNEESSDEKIETAQNDSMTEASDNQQRDTEVDDVDKTQEVPEVPESSDVENVNVEQKSFDNTKDPNNNDAPTVLDDDRRNQSSADERSIFDDDINQERSDTNKESNADDDDRPIIPSDDEPNEENADATKESDTGDAPTMLNNDESNQDSSDTGKNSDTDRQTVQNDDKLLQENNDLAQDSTPTTDDGPTVLNDELSNQNDPIIAQEIDDDVEPRFSNEDDQSNPVAKENTDETNQPDLNDSDNAKELRINDGPSLNDNDNPNEDNFDNIEESIADKESISLNEVDSNQENAENNSQPENEDGVDTNQTELSNPESSNSPTDIDENQENSNNAVSLNTEVDQNLANGDNIEESNEDANNITKTSETDVDIDTTNDDKNIEEESKIVLESNTQNSKSNDENLENADRQETTNSNNDSNSENSNIIEISGTNDVNESNQQNSPDTATDNDEVDEKSSNTVSQTSNEIISEVDRENSNRILETNSTQSQNPSPSSSNPSPDLSERLSSPNDDDNDVIQAETPLLSSPIRETESPKQETTPEQSPTENPTNLQTEPSTPQSENNVLDPNEEPTHSLKESNTNPTDGLSTVTNDSSNETQPSELESNSLNESTNSPSPSPSPSVENVPENRKENQSVTNQESMQNQVQNDSPENAFDIPKIEISSQHSGPDIPQVDSTETDAENEDTGTPLIEEPNTEPNSPEQTPRPANTAHITITEESNNEITNADPSAIENPISETNQPEQVEKVEQIDENANNQQSRQSSAQVNATNNAVDSTEINNNQNSMALNDSSPTFDDQNTNSDTISQVIVEPQTDLKELKPIGDDNNNIPLELKQSTITQNGDVIISR